MDSMRSMQRSLPLSPSRRNGLLSDFRQTAQSLTTLYKNAAAEVDRAYSEGAKEALELLLSGMDRENLGLQEGEGWRVRQMVMELYQGLGGHEERSHSEAPPSNSEESHDEEKPELASSPAKQSTEDLYSQTTAVNTHEQIPDQLEQPAQPEQDMSPNHHKNPSPRSTRIAIPQSDFTFKTQYSPLFDHLTEVGSPEDTYRPPPSAKSAKSTFSLFSTYNPKGPSKTITITPLGPGAGTKRRTSPQAQRFISSTHANRDGTKRVRFNGNDQ